MAKQDLHIRTLDRCGALAVLAHLQVCVTTSRGGVPSPSSISLVPHSRTLVSPVVDTLFIVTPNTFHNVRPAGPLFPPRCHSEPTHWSVTSFK